MYSRSLYPLAVPGGLPAAVAISAQYRQPHTPPTSGLVTTPSHASYLLVLALSAPCAIATGQNKKRLNHSHLSGCFMAQALVSVDAGSGASIFTRVSCPQRLHLRGRFRAVVSARTFRSFPFWHTGQITHPSLTMILPQRMFDCKSFYPLFLRNQREYTYPRDRKE